MRVLSLCALSLVLSSALLPGRAFAIDRGDALSNSTSTSNESGSLLTAAAYDSDSILSSSGTHTLLARESAGPDTFALFGGADRGLEGKFQTAGLIPDRQGWIGVDRTDRVSHWHVDTFNAETLGTNGAGNRAFWSGLDAASAPSWVSAPGYGNSWEDVALFESDPVADPSSGQTVGLDFHFHHDTEPGYDHFVVEYDSAGTWITTLQLDGTDKSAPGVFAAPGLRYADVAVRPITFSGNDYGEGDRIRIRLRVISDSVYSDEDGMWPTEGAVQLDDVTITHADATHFEDFEGSAPYLLAPRKPDFCGDFSDVYPWFTDIDPCLDDQTPVIGFIDYGQAPPNGPNTNGVASTEGSLPSNFYWPPYGIPGGFVVNYTGGLSFGTTPLDNEIWSPPIEWNLPGSEDDEVEFVGAQLRFDVWAHLPLINGMFYQWHVRSHAPGEPWSRWRNRDFVYYGAGVTGWLAIDEDVTDLLVANPAQVQISLGVSDLADLFAFPGDDATPSPVFDNVALKKYRVGGPTITALSTHLANDGFPTSGSIDASSTVARDALDVRFDMIRDVASYPSVIIDPGDSVVVNVTPALPGTEVTQIEMVWALRRNPLFDDVRTAPSGPLDFDVVTSVPGDEALWTGRALSDAVTNSAGAVIEGRFSFDLPDQDFLYPGDLLHYHFRAVDSDGRVSTLPQNTSAFGQEDAYTFGGYDRRFTVRALPSIFDASGHQPRILVVDSSGATDEPDELFFAMSANHYFEGGNYDVYTRGASTSGMSNGIGSAGGHGASASQLEGYEAIFVLGGARSSYVLSDGSASGNHDKGNDLGVLTTWKALPGPHHTVYFGDDLASSLDWGSGAARTYLQTVMGVDVRDRDARDEIGDQYAPLVEAFASGFYSGFTLYGGCPQVRAFDSIVPAVGSTAVAGHRFLDPIFNPVPEPVASVLYNRTVSLARKVDLTFPFALATVRNNPVSAPALAGRSTGADLQTGLAKTGSPALRELFRDVLFYLHLGISSPGSPNALRPVEFAVAPNPFNPRSTFTFAVPRGQRVTIDVFDLRGRRVVRLFEGESNGERQSFTWDATDRASGVYLARMTSDTEVRTQKIALIK